MSSLRTGTAVGLCGLATAWWLSAGAVAPLRAQAPRAAPTDAKARTVGTWRLVGIELLDAAGHVLPPAAAPAFGSPNPVGLMVHGPGGHYGVSIMQSGRRPYAGAAPTPDEAKGALASFLAYFGTYAVDGTRLTHRVEGGLHPNDAGAERTLAFDRTGDRLTLTGDWGAPGIRARLAWQRLSEVAHPTATHRHIAGFWRRGVRERRERDGRLFDSDQARQSGYLIFSPSGYMAVHGMQPGRPRLSSSEPTPDEARRALDTYGSAYFGPYTVYEADQMEITRQIGAIPPAQVGTDARRHYELPSADRLILKPPAEKVDGRELQSFVHWERVGGENWGSW